MQFRRITHADLADCLLGRENFLKQFKVAVEVIVDLGRGKYRGELHHAKTFSLIREYLASRRVRIETH
jgi:hypothetical protein